MRKSLALLFFSAFSLLGADFSGTWRGPFQVKTSSGEVIHEGVVTLELKQTGATVTGQAATGEGTQEIRNGKVEGDTLTFQGQNDDGPMEVRLTLKDGVLAGQATGTADGTKVTAELKLTRQ